MPVRVGLNKKPNSTELNSPQNTGPEIGFASIGSGLALKFVYVICELFCLVFMLLLSESLTQ